MYDSYELKSCLRNWRPRQCAVNFGAALSDRVLRARPKNYLVARGFISRLAEKRWQAD